MVWCGVGVRRSWRARAHPELVFLLLGGLAGPILLLLCRSLSHSLALGCSVGVVVVVVGGRGLCGLGVVMVVGNSATVVVVVDRFSQ